MQRHEGLARVPVAVVEWVDVCMVERVSTKGHQQGVETGCRGAPHVVSCGTYPALL